MVIWSDHDVYRQVGYSSESDLEATIAKVQASLFGPSRIYLQVKKRIGPRNGVKNIPDGYLIDLTGRQPRLYVVEAELAAHDPLRHIAVQILQFSLSFESGPRGVKTILFNAIQEDPEAKGQCEDYAINHGFRHVDHMLEWLVYESPFAALVIIDELPENLETVLAKKFQFGIEVLQLVRFENDSHDRLYQFEPFLADLAEEIETGTETRDNILDAGEIDTIVVPARDDGFRETFLGENCWYPLRIHGTMRPQIKFTAVYRVSPESAITHIAPVKSVEPWKDTGKFVVYFSEPAQEIGPIPLVPRSRVKAPQGPRYTSRQRLESAKTLDDVW